MISKPDRTGAKRWGSGVLVGAVSVLVMGVPFATVADAAATSISVTPTSQNQPAGAGNHADFKVTSQGTPINISYTVISDPNGAVTGSGSTTKFPASTQCTSPTTSPSTCSIPSSGTPGTATVRIFDDSSPTNSAFDSGEQFQDVTVTFSGAPFTVSLSPDSQSTPTGNCAAYTVNATDSAGRPSGNESISIDVHPTGTTWTALSNLTFCTPAGGSAAAATQTPGNNAQDLKGTVTTGDGTNGSTPGQVVFGITSDTAGTATVTASSGASSDSSTQTFTTGGQEAAKTLTVSPSSTSGYTGTGATFTVTAKDSAGNPLSSVVVDYGVTSGPDASGYPLDDSFHCGTTTGSGQATCTVTNGGHAGAGTANTPAKAGTDNVEFWANQTTGSCTHTPGPDSCEPTATAQATFAAPPAFDNTKSTVTCPDQTNGGKASAACTVPVDQKSTTFTATVLDSNSKPVAGAIVTFTITPTNSPDAGAITPTVAPATHDVTTDSNGVATITVTEPSPSTANNETIKVSAAIGTASVGSATESYKNRQATTFTLTPKDETVTNGGTASFVATVLDQFGTGVSGDSISYSVSGRNAGKAGTVKSGSDGTAAISYTDAGVNPASPTDSVSATDTTSNLTDTPSTVHYITGSTSASSVKVATSGVNGPSNAGADVCPVTTAGSDNNNNGGAGNSINGTPIPVCANVTNSSGEVLAGKSVTFTVDKGFVIKTNTTSNSDSNTVTVTTDANGNAYAYVYSNASGTQTVTAKADSATGTGTVTYSSPSQSDARNVALAPATATVTPGSGQKFTATVIDEFGNPVPNVQVVFTQSGPGTIGGGSSTAQLTDANGQASVTVSTASSDSGNGSVKADIGQGFTFNQCSAPAGQSYNFGGPGAPVLGPDPNAKTAGNCTATSTYKVETAPPPPATAQSMPAFRSGSRNNFRGSLTSGPANSSFGFGNAGDVPLWGDWNGDGTPSIGVYRPSNRTFYLANNANTAVAIQVTIGNGGDLPVAGDFNGDGTDSIGLFRPSTGMWYLTNNDHTVVQSIHYGSNGDRPIVGDWFGAGVSQIGVYRPSTGQFFRIGHAAVRFGNIGDTPIVGDWDGNGTTTFGVVRGGATWFVSNNNTSAAASFTFGATGDRPFTWSSGVSPAAPTSS